MRRPAWQITALALLFFGPFLAAILLYAGRGAVGGFEQLPNPDREWLEPPPVVPIAALALAGGGTSDPNWARSRWSLVYAAGSACESRCAESLARLHQVWLALGGERERVRQVLLAPTAPMPESLPATFIRGLIDAPGGAALVELLGPERLAAGRIFVIDPLGNVILSYPGNADQARLLRDLERLLEVSRVG